MPERHLVSGEDGPPEILFQGVDDADRAKAVCDRTQS
jgi:hypothetical protein